MTALRELATRALLGTDKHPGSLPAEEGEIGRALRDMATLDNGEAGEARAVLRMAGLLSICGRAGYAPPRETIAPPALCPPETGATIPPAALEILDVVLRENEPLLRPALRLLRKGGYVLPPALLPRLLDMARRSCSLRPSVGAVAGERGRWLAAQNPEWSALAEHIGLAGQALPDAEIWKRGSRTQRRDYLEAVRRADPARGRELFRETLPELDIEERRELLECFAYGLSRDDEAVLEELLTRDRAKSVKVAAADLLARLPESGYAERMVARLEACLRRGDDPADVSAEGGPARVADAAAGLCVEPPATLTAEWKKDLPEAKKPGGEPLGERAWWLFQLARTVPVGWWEQRTGLGPEGLLAWADTLPWRDALLRAWLAALKRAPEPRWVLALADRAADRKLRGLLGDVADMAALLPPEDQDAFWTVRLHAASGACRDRAGAKALEASLYRLEEALRDTDRAVSEALGHAVGEALIRWARYAGGEEEAMRDMVAPRLACLLPLDRLESVERDWPVDAHDVPVREDVLRVFAAVGAQRRRLRQLLDGEKL